MKNSEELKAKCRKCGRIYLKSEMEEFDGDRGYLCRRCINKWCKIYDSSEVVKIPVINPEWGNSWEKLFSEFLGISKERVIFT